MRGDESREDTDEQQEVTLDRGRRGGMTSAVKVSSDTDPITTRPGVKGYGHRE